VVVLYHCSDARSFRPLWVLEEMGLSYELRMLPFPPRVAAPDYLAINPLGTIPNRHVAVARELRRHYRPVIR
jgi:glutathione S-transferase